MEKPKKLDDILNECLERILTGESLEQCLRSYPEQAAELEPLLQTALIARKASTIQPRPEFKIRTRYQLQSALQEVKPKAGLRFFGWQSRWATTVAIVLVLLLVGSGTVVAAGNSMPDGPLYPVKLAAEQVRLTLTPSALGKAQFYAMLADKRVAEIIYVANKGEPERVELVAQRLNTYLTRVAVLATVHRERIGAPAPSVLAPMPSEQDRGGVGEDSYIPANGWAKLRVALADQAVNHPARLRVMLRTAPESVRPALRRAIARLVVSYEKAHEALE